MAQQYTKQAIKKAFFNQLEKMPLNKITVKSIVEECQINRNTFYYYYADIYAVLQEMMEETYQEAMAEYNSSQSWEDGFIAAANQALKNRTVVEHIYNSLQRSELEMYLYRVAGKVMSGYVNEINRQIGASQEDANRLIAFYQAALMGIVLIWIQRGMRDDPEKEIREAGRLLDGNIEASLRRSKQSA
jgi:AcrR family transcriptional regulator